MAFAEDLGQSGYRFVLGRVQEGGGQPTMPELQAEFEGRLGEVEEALGRYPGPFFMPSFSIVDITFVPNMQRLAAQLPAFRGFRLRGNPSFPRVTEWLEALDARESFRAVKSDDDTLVQVVAKVWARWRGFKEGISGEGCRVGRGRVLRQETKEVETEGKEVGEEHLHLGRRKGTRREEGPAR